MKQNKNHWYNMEGQTVINKRGLARQNMMPNSTQESINENSKLRPLATK